MYLTLAEVAAGADVELPLRLRDLLEVPEGKRFSELEWLRKSPRRDSGPAMSRALGQVDEGGAWACYYSSPVGKGCGYVRILWTTGRRTGENAGDRRRHAVGRVAARRALPPAHRP
jgi:hypothetical protein